MYNDLPHFRPPPTTPEGTGRPPAPTASPLPLHEWHQNGLLALLPEAVRAHLGPRLELVALPLGATLHEAGDTPAFAYFPTTAIVSLLCGNPDGSSAEIAVVGHEGMLGIGAFMSGRGGPDRAVVRGAGQALRLDAPTLRQEFDRGEAATRLLLRYTQALLAQMSQTAVCNRHHPLEQQLGRWLLASLDRSPRPSMPMTHDLIAGALGVRREGVTQALGRLRGRGLIECRRGRVEVLDRAGLAAQACECYASLKTETTRLLGDGADR